MVRTSATRPIVAAPPTQPGIAAAVATRSWGVPTVWPHFAAFTPWPLLLATSDGACSIRRQQTGDDMTKSEVHIPETIDEDSPR
jgi:hypothetical protein